MKQKNLFQTLSPSTQRQLKARRTHGGQPTRGRRKLKRPLQPGKWTHLVLKSKKASGLLSLLTAKNKIFVQRLLYAKAKQFGVRIDDFVNMGNHLHIKLKFSHADQFRGFLRAISGRIARQITQARRGHKFGRFWDGLAFTRILTSSLEALHLKGYFEGNRYERDVAPVIREGYLSDLNMWMRKLRSGPAPNEQSVSL
jgi:REP element-mobilizing transposase RayT